MSNAASRARKRDNAERLGKFQTAVGRTYDRFEQFVNEWIELPPGQILLIVVVVGLIIGAGLMGP